MFDYLSSSFEISIMNNPELRPGIDGGQFAYSARRVFVANNAFNARQLDRTARLCYEDMCRVGVNKLHAICDSGSISSSIYNCCMKPIRLFFRVRFSDVREQRHR